MQKTKIVRLPIFFLKNKIIADIFIILGFTFFSLLILRDLVANEFVIWDLTVSHFDAFEYLKWTFRPNYEISAGGEWIFPFYPTFLEALLTALSNNITAAKLMTIAPVPLSFTTFYYSAKKLSLPRVSSACGAFFYAICPASFALLFSPVQQWFYVFLPLVLSFTLLYMRIMLTSHNFRAYHVVFLSILYAIPLAFMPQGVLLLIPIVLVIILYLIFKYRQDLRRKMKQLLLTGSIICFLTFILLLPFSVTFLLPYFNFFSSGKFVNDPYAPSRDVLYKDTKLYNSIRLAGVGDYHVEELGYNDLANPINLLGLIVYLSVVLAILSVIYKDKYRQRLIKLTSEHPIQFDFLLITLIILLTGVILIELGRNGLLWHLPLSSLLRNPIKPMMLISVSLAFLVSYLIFLMPSFIKIKPKLVATVLFIALLCTASVYSSRYMNGTGWIGPYTQYWKEQGHPIETSDYIITRSMKDVADFARGLEQNESQAYRFFIFPLMPPQMQFFRYNLPLISGDSIGSFDSEKFYSEYIDKVNDLMLTGDNISAISLSPLRGKYITIIDDLNSSAYKGVPYKWGGTRGALAGDPHIFEEILNNTNGFERSTYRNNTYVNTYSSLPLLSYVNSAILMQGNLTDLFNLYHHVTPKNGTTIVPIFANQLSIKEINSLLSSGIIKTIVQNSTNSQSSAETDLYLLEPKSLKSKSYFNDNYTFSNIDAKTPDDSISLKMIGSTVRVNASLPMKHDNIISFRYVPNSEINVTRFDTLFLSLNSSISGLEYRISLFDDRGRQILFTARAPEVGVNTNYELRLADGLTKIRSLQIGFIGNDPAILNDRIDSLELSVANVYLAKKNEKITEINISDLPATKLNNALWIKHAGNPLINKISTTDNDLSDYSLSEHEQGTAFFKFPLRSVNHSSLVTIQGQDLTESIVFATSKHEIRNLTDEISSVLNYPKFHEGDFSFTVEFEELDNKLLILSLLYDGQWLHKSSKGMPIYSFLTGYLLTEGQKMVILKNQILLDTIYVLFIVFILGWVAIGIFLTYKSIRYLRSRWLRQVR